MRVLLDTNIIIRAAQPNQPTWADISQALTTLITILTPQEVNAGSTPT